MKKGSIYVSRVSFESGLRSVGEGDKLICLGPSPQWADYLLFLNQEGQYIYLTYATVGDRLFPIPGVENEEG